MEASIFSKDFLLGTLSELWFFSSRMAFIWVPASLGVIAWRMWIRYKQALFLDKLKFVLLDIKVPKDVSKSPLAMEIVLNALFMTFGESTWYDTIVLGKIRPDFSLEIASIEGDIHFFIRCAPVLRKTIEYQIYSQYPTAEVYEAPDYTLSVPYAKENSTWSLFGIEHKLAKPDPYPIKTYIDYALDEDKFEEKKVDPLTATLEYFGSIGRGEQLWLQIMVRANKGKKDPTTLWKRDWKDESQELVKEIMEKAKERSGPPPDVEGETQDFRFSMLTGGERNTIEAIERNVSKLGFDCGIRILYLARNDAYDSSNISGLFGALRQYTTNDLNGFSRIRHTDIDYPWQKYIDFDSDPISLKGDRIGRMKWRIFDAYRRRSWFFPPYERKPFVLNTEELATIYHFPGRVSETPTFSRIESKKSEPPSNLPV